MLVEESFIKIIDSDLNEYETPKNKIKGARREISKDLYNKI